MPGRWQRPDSEMDKEREKSALLKRERSAVTYSSVNAA
jgi:hypothetical protein